MKKYSLSPEQEYLIKSVSLGENKTEYKEGLDWRKFIEESRVQGVSVRAFTRTGARGEMPKKDYDAFMVVCGNALSNNYRVYDELKNLVDILNGKISYVVLKGASAAQYYDNPQERLIGDIDVLVKNRDFAAAADLLYKNGYVKEEEENDHHAVFNKRGILIELHYKLSGMPSDKIGERLAPFALSVFDDAKVKTVGDYSFYSPDDAHNALILLLHLQHHILVEGVGLRHILDWAYFINKTAKEPFWEQIIPLFKSAGLYVFARAVTKTCAVYLGSFLPEWAKDYPEDVCEELLCDVLRQGNFGVKTGESPGTEAFLPRNGGKRRGIFKVMHGSVISHYPFLKKWKILYPFFYCYRVLQYGFLTLLGKRKSVNSLVKQANEREKLYAKFCIFKEE